jgi:CRISPR-associated protein Cas1
MNTLQGTFKEFCESKVTLYFTHRDVDAKVNANHLVYENQRTGLKKSVELNRIRRIVFVGIPGFTGDAIYHLCRRTIPIDFLDIKGEPVGQVMTYDPGVYETNVSKQEKFISSSDSLEVAREVIMAKVENSAELLRRRLSEDELPDWKSCKRLLNEASSIDELRGAEGISAKYYFSKWNDILKSFKWEGRHYHPALGPINTMLSMGYTLMYNRMSSGLRAAGMNPRLGFFHMIRGRHSALASDLIEPFRNFVDAAVLRMISLGMVKPDQFTTDEYGRSIIDDNDCYHTLITEFEKMFSKECKLFRKTDNHWHSVVRSINDHIDDLAFSFSRYLKSNTPLHAMRVRPCKDI